MKIELLGFTTPNYVIQKMPARQRQEGITEAPKYALSDVPAEDLASLCDHFRSEIFRKAGKTDPVTADRSVGWQPIETAPTDDDVLVYFPTHDEASSVLICHQFADADGWYHQNADQSSDELTEQPTHWMPLPSPPEAK